MTELQNGSEIRTELSNPQEKHDYYFDVDPNQAVMITFTAPSFEYAVKYFKKAYPLDKGGPANAHDGGEVDFGTEATFTFNESAKQIVYLTVASATASMQPSDGYTISMSVAA